VTSHEVAIRSEGGSDRNGCGIRGSGASIWRVRAGHVVVCLMSPGTRACGMSSHTLVVILTVFEIR
jgi:hypothetical protein